MYSLKEIGCMVRDIWSATYCNTDNRTLECVLEIKELLEKDPLNLSPEIGEGQETPDQTSNEGAPITLDIAAKFSDPEGDGITYTATGLPDALAIDVNTGLITGSIAQGASANSPYSVAVTATDSQGNSTECPFQWDVLAVFTRSTQAVWNHNNNGGTSNDATLSNNDCVNAAQPIQFGAGLQYPGSGWAQGSTFEWVVSGVDTNSKADSIAADDYVDFQFTANQNGAITNFYHGLEPQRNATGAGDYNYCLDVSDDGGTTFTTLAANEYMPEPQTGGDNGPNTRVNKSVSLSSPTVAGTTYIVRMYIWSAGSSGPAGSARFPNTANPLPAGSVAVDDVSINVEC